MLLLKAGKEHFVVFSVAFSLIFIWKQCKGIQTCTQHYSPHNHSFSAGTMALVWKSP